MISKSHRFHGYGSLRFVYQQGKTVRGPLMALKFAPNPRRRSYRLAVVVSRKVHKSAVKRNRIRRRIYEIIRHHMPEFKTPSELVITVYQAEVADLSADDLQKAINELLKKARL